MRVELVGIDAVAKVVDAVTSKTADYVIVIRTDDYQSRTNGDKRGFMVDVYYHEVYDEMLDEHRMEKDADFD